ncbi:hypothetical protein FM107_15795 [Sphingobacterium sp. JB170]|nr:hypothetical protein FM107_15795 [Sphingobacterium sp. JB170]
MNISHTLTRSECGNFTSRIKIKANAKKTAQRGFRAYS